MSLTDDIVEALDLLSEQFEGDLHHSDVMRTLYATDASVYREMPLAVALPHNESDIIKLVKFAIDHNTFLIPRAAGTSLAGQTVGAGIVVDVSKYINSIIKVNHKEQWAIVEPGVVRDELNHYVAGHGLFFSPITSTANRATIGGMVGNNSSGTTSIMYGCTRDKIIEIRGVLSDGSIVVFSEESLQDYQTTFTQDSLSNRIRTHLYASLSKKELRDEILRQYPYKSIHRRNTGYALDVLSQSDFFDSGGGPYNIGKLISGSEGTLMFITKVKIKLDPLPPAYRSVLAVHCTSINESLKATQVAMTHKLYACELMDKIILDCTKDNPLQLKNRSFVQGDPEAILLLEVRSDDRAGVDVQLDSIKQDMIAQGFGYAYSVISGDESKGVWELRSAGLGLLANLEGDAKAVACIEDTAVALDDLPDYIADFNAILSQYDQRAVHYAHAGAGEIHLRPILDLKKSDDRQQFYNISEATARLVKKYNGSLSGEHGDGRVRAPFIPMMVGEHIYDFYKELKHIWDPHNIFNRGKILYAPPMNESLRYEADQQIDEVNTLMDFGDTGGILRAAEKCNGSGDCRKLPLSGGTMCPSYQATRNEKETTRARANILREHLTHSTKPNKFDHHEIKEVLDLCLSCKGCSSECPSNVNMTILKSEFQYQYFKANGIPFRSLIFAHINELNRLASILPGVYNFAISGKTFVSQGLKKMMGVHSERSLPALHHTSVKSWYRKNYNKPSNPIKTLYFFCDEFTNYNDAKIGIVALRLLMELHYHVILLDHQESGRAALSKGLLLKARKHAEYNVQLFEDKVSANNPLVGIEPSAILGFRDEYKRLVGEDLKNQAIRLSENTLTIDEFLSEEYEAGNVKSSRFDHDSRTIHLHGHCHQKALSDIKHTITILSIPSNYHVQNIPSGCCGMAGSFGYEHEHYEVSKSVANLVLLPALNKAKESDLICAPGTSCRHQIKDLANKNAQHPIQILYDALIK